ncbi:hypothetical protein EVA_06866 [gut metagenome]|uniref:Uncharacterized protein n=1 Tax=gut metagenome TaxID=749906 RepID=J9GCG7_9ZZZZ
MTLRHRPRSCRGRTSVCTSAGWNPRAEPARHAAGCK